MEHIFTKQTFTKNTKINNSFSKSDHFSRLEGPDCTQKIKKDACAKRLEKNEIPPINC